jgi:hypothetical protein
VTPYFIVLFNPVQQGLFYLNLCNTGRRFDVKPYCLTKSTALLLAQGWHAYLDRFEAILNNQVPPDWAHRFAEVKELYPSYVGQQ